MVTYLKQAILGKEMFLKPTNNFLSIVFLLLIPKILFANQGDLNLKEKIILYIENITNISSKFIQVEGGDISDGFLYIKDERIKIEYKNPSEITIILSKNKAMYFNKDLNEIEYFNPNKTLGDIFYNVFYNKNFFSDSELLLKENSLTLSKKINVDKEENLLEVFFETSPLIIRRVEIENEQKNKLVLSISNINYDPIFEKKFFSMVNPLLQ